MGIDHMVTDLEIDVDNLTLDLEIFDLDGCLGNRVLLLRGPAAGPYDGVEMSGLQVAVHEVDLL
jgi:hypothetical protein